MHVLTNCAKDYECRPHESTHDGRTKHAADLRLAPAHRHRSFSAHCCYNKRHAVPLRSFGLTDFTSEPSLGEPRKRGRAQKPVCVGTTGKDRNEDNTQETRNKLRRAHFLGEHREHEKNKQLKKRLFRVGQQAAALPTA